MHERIPKGILLLGRGVQGVGEFLELCYRWDTLFPFVGLVVPVRIVFHMVCSLRCSVRGRVRVLCHQDLRWFNVC